MSFYNLILEVTKKLYKIMFFFSFNIYLKFVEFLYVKILSLKQFLILHTTLHTVSNFYPV